MFIALRDLRFARGRFALVGSVIALMTFMVVMLSGLTAGLGSASVSAIEALPIDHIALEQPAPGQDPSFATSALPPDSATNLAGEPGVSAAYPLGITTTQLDVGGSAAAVSVFGTDPALVPAIRSGQPAGPAEVGVTEGLAETKDLHPGDRVTVGGQQVTVGAIVADTSFNHLPVVYTDVVTWQQIAHTDRLTAVGLVGAPASPVAGVTVVTRTSAFGAVGAYTSEQGSLNLMRILLIAVSALVVGSFFTVWTMQRSGDLAVVRAIGGSRGYLLRDALGQAVIVLLAGAVVGTALAWALGLLAARIVPFDLSALTVAVPLVAMIGVGLLGAVFAIRRITTVDPLTALGAAR